MHSLIEEMPESVEVYSLYATDMGEMKETEEIPVARLAEYYLKSQYERPVSEYFEQLIDAVNRSALATQDAINLSHFNLDNLSEDDSRDQAYQQLRARLDVERENIMNSLAAFRENSGAALDEAIKPLSSSRILENTKDFISGLRSYQGRRVILSARDYFDRVLKYFQKQLTRLSFTRSTALLKTRTDLNHPDLRSVNSELLDFRDKIRPTESVMQSLPQYYLSLFSGKSSIGKEFWIKRPIEEEAFRKAYARFSSGIGGGVMILGDRNSGKSALAKYVIQNVLKLGKVFTVYPPMAGSNKIEDFTTSLRNATNLTGDVEQILSQIPSNSAIIINDLELFWERTAHGLAVVEKLCDLIDRFGNRFFFIVNMNSYAYRHINRISRLKDHFIEVINMQPFDAEELKDLVLKRHKSSNMAFGYSRESGQLNELQVANLFDHYFDFSRGVPGIALIGWLGRIEQVQSDFIRISKPDYPSLGLFRLIDQDWIALLVQFVLHKRLTKEKIRKIFDWEVEKTEQVTSALIRSGLIIEKSTRVYQLDGYVYPFVVNYLKNKEILS